MSKESFKKYQEKRKRENQKVRDNQHGASRYNLDIQYILPKEYSPIRIDSELFIGMQTRNTFWHI